jgi:hypothetical protein
VTKGTKGVGELVTMFDLFDLLPPCSSTWPSSYNDGCCERVGCGHLAGNGGINLMRWKEMEQLGMTQKHAVDKHANQMTQKAPPLH